MIEILDKFLPIIELAQLNKQYKDVDTIIVTGGRNSFKSFHVSLISAVLFRYYNWKILFSRYTWSSAKDSIIEEIKEKISILNIDATQLTDRIVLKSEKETENLDNSVSPQIVFKGIKTSSGNQTANLKSLKGFNCFIVDEGEEQPLYKDWKKVKRSLRRPDLPNVAIIVLNPTPKSHWIYTEFFEKKDVQAGFNGVKDNILYIHSMYTDKLKWVTKENIKDFESTKYDYTSTEISTFKEKKYTKKGEAYYDNNNKLILANEYKFTILGGFRERAEGVIFTNWKYGEFDDSLPYVLGQDFGTTHPDALVKVAVDNKLKKLYIHELIYETGLSTDNLVAKMEMLVKHRKFKKTDIIIADSAQPRTIKDIKNKGFVKIRAAKKGPGSVLSGIKKMGGYEIIITKLSKNIAKELNHYVWAEKNEVPIKENDDALDAARYAGEVLFKKKNLRQIK